MTVLRLISPAARSGLVMSAGIGLLVTPLLLELSTAALVTGIAVGVLAIELGLAGTGSGRGSLPLSAQAAYDRGLALGLLLVALIFGLSGESDAAPVFAAAGAVALVVTSITRYSGAPA
jgi:hypothetical protein